jgi:hypothetical protein
VIVASGRGVDSELKDVVHLRTPYDMDALNVAVH